MMCLYCGGETKVTNSRHQRRNNHVWRRRQCLTCNSVFTTHESVEISSSLSVRQADTLVPFLPDLLLKDLMLALQDRKDAYTACGEILSTTVRNLLKLPQKPVYSTSDISKTTADVLKKFDKRAHLRFVAEHPSLQK